MRRRAASDNYDGESMDTYPIDTAPYRGVIEAAAARMGWGRTLPKRHGLGIAAHRSFVSYVCTAVEVAVGADGTIRIPREVARMPECPEAIDVVLIDSDAAPGGVGEPGLPPFAPALCNALFAATGTRIRRLPIGARVKV